MKKNNYNIQLNPEPLNSEQINQHKDFDALLQLHQASPETNTAPQRGRRRWLYRGVAATAAACIGLLAYFGVNSINTPSSANIQKAYFASQPYINPPIKGVEAQFVSQDINANQGGVYEYANGSKVIVPPAAFEDQAGQVVEGAVNIRYREFHDFIDFFLSGIPMEYDSAGVRYNLESAGMIEIYAEQDGQRLNIRPGKKIDVELVSEVWVKDKNDPLNFNIYHLDTEQRNWVYRGVDQIERIEESASDLLQEETAIQLDYQNQLVELQQQEAGEIERVEASIPRPMAPVRPQRASNDAHVFNFAFDEEVVNFGTFVPGEAQQEIEDNIAAINELREKYKNTMWQVAPNNENFSEAAAEGIAWEDMKLRKLNNRDYELTLIKGENNMKVIVNPVLTGDDYEAALTTFNQEFSDYEQAIAEREALLSEQKAALAQRFAEERALTEKSYEERIAIYQAQGKDHLATKELIKQKIINRFAATTFGIWNCDRPLPPYIHKVKGEFIDNHDSDLHQNTAFLVDKTQNTVCRFYATKGADVLYNRNSDKMMWIVTKDNKIALFKKEGFKKINQKRNKHTFVMDLVDKEIKTEEDVRKILFF
ncbi:MAG: hypothetical protein AAGD05_13025 [Bacteroidota bacterium]